MKVNDLAFPVLCFWRHLFRVEETVDGLLTTTKAGLKNKMFEGLLIVDSQGRAVRAESARKLHGVGPFWGYNIFLNQRIRIELVLAGESQVMDADSVRRMVLDSFAKWGGWQTRGDFEELKASVERAKSVGEIINLVAN